MDTIGRSLADGAAMLWQTLWALILGFTLSGAVQAFVSRRRMQEVLGDHGPGTIARAGVLGAASSSCSYAASALAKTLFARGADFTASMVFMVASTNLVIELGVVLWLLIGWEFALAEFVGGAIMIALLSVLLPRALPAAELEPVRAQLDAVDGHAPADAAAGNRIRSWAGWADAAAYTVGDLVMLRRELVIGFVVAGFADIAVPMSWWQSLFITGHGFGSALENAVLGPLLAIVSFVCSIGNVPLAAALWSGGSTFGGVMSFVFADLITLPLLLIYRRYYGTRLMLRLLAVMWLAMSVAGLLTDYLFRGIGITPDTHPTGRVGSASFGLNATTVLDLVALVVLAGLVVLYRLRSQLGGGTGFATDPICGMQVDKANPGAVSRLTAHPVFFCSDHCRARWESQQEVRSPA
jgi:uncharacterized membrane protein YraQ (UPF0718 family)/YHS domain-containing protein